jgi:hypothetical protein
MSAPPPGFTTIVALLAFASTSACRDEPEPPPIIWEGEHLRFGTDADDSTLCAGTLPYLDGATGYLATLFGRPDAQVDYYWLPDGTQPHCNGGADGCTTDHGVFSRYAIHQHELVHAVRRPNTSYLPLEEGLAEAHGDDWSRFSIQGDIRELLSDPSNGYIPGPGYGLAAHFVSYLEATHGLEPFIELNAATSHETSFSQAQAAFEQVYDQSLDAAIADYEAEYPRCDTRVFRDKAFDCSRNVVAAPAEIDGKLDMTVSMSCDDPAVLGPRLGERWTTVALDVEVAARYHIVVRPEQSSALELFQITRCDLSCFEYPDDLPSRTTGTQFGSSLCLEQGRYLFRFSIDEDDLDDYRLIVQAIDITPIWSSNELDGYRHCHTQTDPATVGAHGSCRVTALARQASMRNMRDDDDDDDDDDDELHST